MLGSSSVMNTIVTQAEDTATGMEKQNVYQLPPGIRPRHSAASASAAAREGSTVRSTNSTETRQLFQNSSPDSSERYRSKPQNATAWPRILVRCTLLYSVWKKAPYENCHKRYSAGRTNKMPSKRFSCRFQNCARPPRAAAAA